jgi:lauroyl/myristoyl acyltransferase
VPTLIALRFGLLLARVLPLGACAALAAAAWRLGGLVSPRRAVVAANLAAIAAAGGRCAGVSAVFASYGRYWGELLALAARPARCDRLRIRVEGREHLEAASRGPVCFLGAHLGNWDLLSRWLARRFPGLCALAEELEPPALAALFAGLREAAGQRTIAGPGAGLALYRELRRGRPVGMLIDRALDPASAAGQGLRAAPFFGGPRAFPAAGLELAQRAGATLLPIFLLREPGGYVIKVSPALPAGADPLAGYARALAAAVAAHPEQWCVLYPLHDGELAARVGESAKGAAA